jgi:hypothetical protein
MTRAGEPGREVLVVCDPMAEADCVPTLEAIGLSSRCSRYSGSRAWIRLRDRPRSSRKDCDLYLATKRDLAMRTWRHKQDYADAESGAVAEILARTKDGDP